jgi:hypothetical protein
MKYIKKFDESEKSIEDWCKELKLNKYVIKDDIVNVNSYVNINRIMIKQTLDIIPIQFGIVYGYFSCCNHNITSLKGSPKIVYSLFECGENKLLTLEGCPEKIKSKWFSCTHNKLKTLEGGPKEVNGLYSCDNNELTTLEGCPKEIDSLFSCTHNKLKSLEGGPVKVGENYFCSNNELITLQGRPLNFEDLYFSYGNNPICETTGLIGLFGSLERYILSIEEYNYSRGCQIYVRRFEKACLDAGIKMPNSIPGYEYI